MKQLSLADLKAARSCDRDMKIFADLYGEAGEVTHERVMAGALQFDWSRCHILLSPRQRQYFKVLCLAAFRGVERQADPNKSRRKKAMANAFFLAYNSPLE